MSPADRLYYDDPALTSFTAEVTDIREFSRKNGQSLWQIALDRTAFYPTSGGQPFDTGSLSATARSGATLVAEIDEVTEDDDGEVWHTTSKPVLAGTAVTGSIHQARRLDHMQQHSGQHLLSAVFLAQTSVPTVSFHLGEQASTIDLAVDGPDAQAALIAAMEAVERTANEHIAADHPVTLRTVSHEEAQALLAAGSLRKLPPRIGPMRLVEIPGIDLNACGGTHVRSLGQIGGLLLRGHERVKQGLRVEFVCGLRAVCAARSDYSVLSETAAALSVARADAGAAVARLLEETKALVKEKQKLREEVASHHAVRLAVEEQINGGIRLVSRTLADHDADYVRLLASRIIASVPHTAALLLSTAQEPATLVLASNLNLPKGCGDLLKEALVPLGLRGGGTPTLAHAKLPRIQAEQVAAHLRAQLS
jgi:alanyl-tRNA synthetase